MELLANELLRVISETIPILRSDKLPIGLNDTLDKMFHQGLYLDRERINILLSFWHLPPMTIAFFDYYFEDILIKKEDIIKGLNKFIKDALWHFGDLENAYLELIEVESIDDFFKSHQFDIKSYGDRLEWSLIENITPNERGYLGYVSGERPFKHKKILTTIEGIIQEFESDYENLKNLEPEEISTKILNGLKDKFPDIDKILKEYDEVKELGQLDLFSSTKLQENKIFLSNIKLEIEKTIKKVEELKNIGIRNQEQYLRNIESIDVYVATSMRDDKEYIEMANFVNDTFKNDYVNKLNLRYFDPTLCYCDSRIDKGIIECLLVRNAKVTIYCAQEGDTFGKDSELAASIVQGKPAIVYVPNNGEDSDKRASIFKDFHPLGLQVGLYDGVARGVIVVRSAEDCAKVLYNILTNKLETTVNYEQHGIVLREKITNSVVRVMTGWGLLSSAFWNNFERTKNPKSGSCI